MKPYLDLFTSQQGLGAIGVTLCQLAWAFVVFGLSGKWLAVGFGILVIFEYLVPILAERKSATEWHRGHIIERYGLLTIIVLGEAILASYNGIQMLIVDYNTPLCLTIFIRLMVAFPLLWVKFAVSTAKNHCRQKSMSTCMRWRRRTP